MTPSRPPRWLLALESSTSRGGAALVEAGEPVLAVDLEEGLRHGRDLMPAVAAVLEQSRIAPEDLDAVAVSVGPGSYTGLRVGVMAAKSLAFALHIPVIGVSSLEALAETLRLRGDSPPGTLFVAVQNARRDEVYLGSYRIREAGVEPVLPDRAVTPEEAAAYVAGLGEAGEKPLCAGTALAQYAELFAPFIGEATPYPEAGAAGRIGWRRFMREKTADPLQLQPVYLRRDPDADWRHDILMR